jgi:uncharacterized OsmC-like protein
VTRLAAALVVLAATSVSAQELTTVVGTYCATCHNGRLRSPGGLLLESFSGAGGEHTHRSQFTFGADHPAVLVGEDRGPTPIEFLLHGLAACITAGLGNIAAARGVTLTSVESRVEGDIDLQGILGLSDRVRNGYERIGIAVDIAGDAPPEKLRQIVEQSRARSAVTWRIRRT